MKKILVFILLASISLIYAGNDYTTQEVLNLVLDGNTLGIHGYTTQDVLNLVYDETNDALRVSTGGGDVEIDSLQVDGNAVFDSTVTFSKHTAGRVFYSGVGGLLSSDGNFLYDGTDVSLAALSKYYLDGGSDTYIVESSADVTTLMIGGIPVTFSEDTDMTFALGGDNFLKWNAATNTFDLLGELNIGTFDGTADTYQTWIDMEVSSALSAGDDVGFAVKIDANSVFSVMADADGSGGITGQRTVTNGGQVNKVTTVSTSTYTVLASDYFISVSRTATGACAITLNTALQIEGTTFVIKDSGFLAGTNNITIDCQDAADTIDGDAAGYTISTNKKGINLTWDATVDSWLVW